MKTDVLRNPVWKRMDNLRDPAVYKDGDVYHVFYSRYSNGDWSKPEDWAIGHALTKDFVTFTDDMDISPKGAASPGDLIFWNGKYILPYQFYPEIPTMLCYSTSVDLYSFTKPVPFLEEARDLPWNTARRVIDPSFVVEGKRLHCFFVGTDNTSCEYAINLVGHAYTDDPGLEKWVITTVDKPLIGVGERNTDGAENVTIYPVGDHYGMIFSEGLKKQHLAYAESKDLLHWDILGEVKPEMQSWMVNRYGAPYVWKEDDRYYMILMGEDEEKHTSLGILTSEDGIHWTQRPERTAEEENAAGEKNQLDSSGMVKRNKK